MDSQMDTDVSSLSSNRDCESRPPAAHELDAHDLDRLCQRCCDLIAAFSNVKDPPWESFGKQPIHHFDANCALCDLISQVIKGCIASPSLTLDNCRVFIDYFPDRSYRISLAPYDLDYRAATTIKGWTNLRIISKDTQADASSMNRFIDFAAINAEILKCQATHSRCQNRRTNSDRKMQPIKLIDCYERSIVQAGPDDVYMALSYVWGRADAVANCSSSRNCLPEQLPPLIEDSLAVTKRLGYRYLWIDRYCIDQTDKDEVKTQVQQMDLIYSGAICCIIAAAAQDPSVALPGVTQPRAILPWLDLSSKSIVASRPKADEEIQQSMWASRGWTYQEAVFSKRRLYILGQETKYDCSSTAMVEPSTADRSITYPGPLFSMPTMTPMRKDHEDGNDTLAHHNIADNDLKTTREQKGASQSFKTSPKYSEVSRNEANGNESTLDGQRTSEAHDAEATWPSVRIHRIFKNAWDHITSYNSRELTHPVDALLAIQGIFSSLTEIARSVGQRIEFFFGIPVVCPSAAPEMDVHGDGRSALTHHRTITKCLARGLLWDYCASHLARRAGFPSWTWASSQSTGARPVAGTVSRKWYPLAGVRFEVQLNDDENSPRMTWDHFCHQHLFTSCDGSSFHDLHSTVLPVLTLYGAFFPVVTRAKLPETWMDDYIPRVWGLENLYELTNEDKEISVDFGRQTSSQETLPGLTSTCGCRLVVPLLVSRNEELLRWDVACMVVQGTSTEGTFERVGCCEIFYEGPEAISEIFATLCELRPRYRVISEEGIRLV